MHDGYHIGNFQPRVNRSLALQLSALLDPIVFDLARASIKLSYASQRRLWFDGQRRHPTAVLRHPRLSASVWTVKELSATRYVNIVATSCCYRLHRLHRLHRWASHDVTTQLTSATIMWPFDNWHIRQHWRLNRMMQMTPRDLLIVALVYSAVSHPWQTIPPESSSRACMVIVHLI